MAMTSMIFQLIFIEISSHIVRENPTKRIGLVRGGHYYHLIERCQM